MAALYAGGSLTYGQANSLTNTINNVPAKLATGHVASAQSMLADFIAKVGPMVTTGPLSAEDGQALIHYAARISAAAACTPVAKTPWGQLKKAAGPSEQSLDEPEVENELFGDEFDPELVLLQLEGESE